MKTVHIPDVQGKHTFTVYTPGMSNLQLFMLAVTLTVFKMLWINQKYTVVILEFIIGITAMKLLAIWLEKSFPMVIHIDSSGIVVAGKVAKFNFVSVKNIIIGQEEPNKRFLEGIPNNLISITLIGASRNETIFVYDNGDSLLATENLEQ